MDFEMVHAARAGRGQQLADRRACPPKWTQLELPDIKCDPLPAKPTLEERFREFHAAHPEMLEVIIDKALELKRLRRKASAKGIIEDFRWTQHQLSGHAIYKVNNSFTSYYARLAMLCEPRLKGFFELRNQAHECDLSDLVEGYHEIQSNGN